MAFAYDPRNVFRDFVTDGVPASGKHDPKKAEIRSMLAERDAVIEAGLSASEFAYLTRAELFADLAHEENAQAWVVADSTTAYNGVYRKSGASGAGSWSRIADLPYSFIRAANAGTGTANAVQATSTLPVPTGAYVALVSVNFAAANTGAMTLSINGETARDLVTNTGDPVPSGYVTAGMAGLVTIDENGDYRFFNYGNAEAVQAAAEAALADLLARYLGALADDAAATAAAGGSPVEGQLYWNTTSSLLKIYDGGWVSATQSSSSLTVFIGAGDGAETDFTLAATAQFANTLLVIDGRLIRSGYTLEDGALSLSEAPATGVPVEAYTFDIVPLGATSAGLVSVADAGGYFAGDDVEEALQELGAAIITGSSATSAKPEDYPGCDPTGLTDSTSAVVAAMQSGKPDLVLDGTYLVDELTWDVATCPSLKRFLGNGRGTLKQRAANANILHVDGVQDAIIDAIRLQGIHSAGLTEASNLDNRGIILEEAHGAKLYDIYGTRTKFQVVHNLGSDDIRIWGLKAIETGIGYSCRGGKGASLRGFRVIDPIFADTVFTIGISYESTDGHSYGAPEDITLDDVIVRGFFNAQGVMAHAGRRLHYSNITIDGSMLGWSVNPASSAGPDDIIDDVTVNGLNVDMPTDSPPSGWSGGNSAVIVAAGGTTPDIIQVALSGVNIRNGNRSEQAANGAAVSVWSTKRFSMTAFNIMSSWATAIFLNDDNTMFSLAGGVIDSITPVSGVCSGVRCNQSTNDGFVGGISFKDIDGIGVNRGSATSSVAIGTNRYRSVTTETA